MDDLGNGLFMGLARLSIVDLDPRANQPMYIDGGNYVISFNGEIYNYVELKRELTDKGHRFQTTSDTEVLVHSYIEWGSDCLHKLNGMFAFVIYDKRRNALFAARDRFGIKPLYLYQRGDKVGFASEIKQFSALDSYEPVANEGMVVDFISWRIRNHTHQTMFRDVYQLRGGQYLEVRLSEPLPRDLIDTAQSWYPYTRLVDIPDDDRPTDQIITDFRDLFYDAVKIRLRADVEIATCLSGGIDSSSLTCVRGKISDALQPVFSCRDHDSEFDEYEYAEAVIRDVPTSAQYTTFTEYQDILKQAENLIWFNDEPIASVSIIVQQNLFRSIQNQRLKVALSGQGADEVLGTYGNTTTFFRELLRRRKMLRLSSEIGHESRKRIPAPVHRTLRLAASIFRNTLRSGNLYAHLPSDVYSFESDHVHRNPHNYLAEEMGLDIGASMKDYSAFLISCSSLPMLLQYDDRTSMSCSIEERVPYLDYRLVEFVLSVPSDLRIKNGESKHLLKESVRDILPEEIYKRKTKLGFGTPQNKWIEGEMRDELVGRVAEIADRYPIFDPGKVKEIIDGGKGGWYSSLLWRMIFFDIWARKFNVRV